MFLPLKKEGKKVGIFLIVMGFSQIITVV